MSLLATMPLRYRSRSSLLADEFSGKNRSEITERISLRHGLVEVVLERVQPALLGQHGQILAGGHVHSHVTGVDPLQYQGKAMRVNL